MVRWPSRGSLPACGALLVVTPKLAAVGPPGRQQGFDFAIAFGDLPKQALMGGEVLRKREQVLGAIAAG